MDWKRQTVVYRDHNKLFTYIYPFQIQISHAGNSQSNLQLEIWLFLFSPKTTLSSLGTEIFPKFFILQLHTFELTRSRCTSPDTKVIAGFQAFSKYLLVRFQKIECLLQLWWAVICDQNLMPFAILCWFCYEFFSIWELCRIRGIW